MYVGDSLNTELGFFPKYDASKHGSPVDYLLDLLVQHGQNRTIEQRTLMTNAKQECSGNVDTVVKVSGEFDHSKWHLNRLNGCLATSDCGKKAARYTGEGTNYTRCVRNNRDIYSEQLVRAKEASIRKAEKEALIKAGNAKRQANKNANTEHLNSHNEAIKALTHINELLTTSKTWKKHTPSRF